MRKLWATLAAAILIGCCTPYEHAPTTPVSPTEDLTLYDSILIEVQPTTRSIPNLIMLEKFREELDRYRIAPYNNIRFVINAPSDTDQTFWFYSDVRSFESSHRDLYDNDPDDRHLVAFLCYLPGVVAEPGRLNVIGLHYDDTSMAFWVRASEDREVPTLMHEFGHLIHLANDECNHRLPFNPLKPNHCNNPRCIMHWFVPNSRNGIMPNLDEQCLRDLLDLIEESQ